MLAHKVLLSGKPWNILTLIYSLGAHLAPLIIDLHSSSLVEVQGRSHRPDSHSTWHAERGTDCCSKETVNPKNQLHVSHRSFILTFPHEGTVAQGTVSVFSTSQKKAAKRFQFKQKITELLNLQNDCVTESSRCLKGRNSGFGATSRNKQNTHIPAVKSVNIVERGTHMPMHEVVEITYREKEEGCMKGRESSCGSYGFSGKPYFQQWILSHFHANLLELQH